MAGWRITLWAVLVVAALWFLYMVRGILLPFILAAVIATLLDPVVRKLRKRGMSRGGAIWTVFGVFSLAGVLLMLWLAPLVGNQIGNFRGTIERFSSALAAPNPNHNYFVRWNPVVVVEAPASQDIFDRVLADVQPMLSGLGLPTTRKAIYDRYVAPNSQQIAKAVQNFFNGFFGIIANLTSQLMLLVLTPIIVVMILYDIDSLKRRGLSWVPPSLRAETTEIINDVSNVIGAYFRGMMMATAIYMTASMVILTILQVPYSILLGILLGVLYLIPFIGMLISYAILFTICFLSGRDSWLFMQFSSPVIYALIPVCAQIVFDRIFDTFISPRVVGKAVGLNPLVSMFVIFSGGALFGLPGMVLAFPMAGAVKVVLDRLVRVATVHPDTLALPAVPVRHRT